MPPKIPLINRMQLDEETGCWNWRGCRTTYGYGVTHYLGQKIYAHRLSAHLWLRMPLDSDKFVCHSCDNPPCFNPKHLFIGTASDNLRDAVNKGRNYSAKKTHCKWGHAFTEENTLRWGNSRQCRTCARRRASEQRAAMHFVP